MIGVEFFIILGVLIAWAVTISKVYEKLSDLKAVAAHRERIIEDLFDAINGEWETKSELYALVADLPSLDKLDEADLVEDERPISN